MRRLHILASISLLPLLVLPGCTKAGTRPAYRDGTYFATFDVVDGQGWKPRLEIAVRDGRIATVAFDSVSVRGTLKSRDPALAAALKKARIVTPPAAAAELEKRLKRGQAAPVDAVTGATRSTEDFNALAAAILAKAATGDTSRTVLVMNDTYGALEPGFDSRGYRGEIAITYVNGRIATVRYDETTRDSRSKRADAAYASNMGKTSPVTPDEAMAALEGMLVQTQDPARVDVVTGATETSRSFVELARKAIAGRK